jgi:ABC-2 type transport system permease protein
MFEVTRYEARRRVRGALVLTALLAVFALFVVYLYPSIAASGVDFETYIESLPPAFQEGFVGDASLTTVEGFLSTEMYQFLWLIMLGLYIAYSAGSIVASDVESGRMDMLLAAPVSRSRVLVEKYLALLVPILLVNLVTPFVVYGGLLAIGERVDTLSLFAVHLLSIPYLLASACCCRCSSTAPASPSGAAWASCSACSCSTRSLRTPTSTGSPSSARRTTTAR